MTIFLYGYIHSKIHKFLNYIFTILLKILCKLVAKRSRTQRSVVLVANHVGSRICKIGYGLKSAGWHVVLLHSEDFDFDASISFHVIHRYSTPYEALLLAIKYTPVVYHIFSSWNFDLAYLFVKYKPGKIVFDDYDVMAGMVKKEFAEKNYPGQVDKERFCLENSDGLCCRSIETEYVEEKLGYHFKGKRILFLDYCWGIENNKVISQRMNAEIHVVNVGNLAIEKYTPQEQLDHCFGLFLASFFSKNRVHFHLYPPISKFLESKRSSWENEFKERYSDYIEFQKNSKYFHLHYPIPPNRLPNELNQYDFGVLVMSRKIAPVDGEAYCKTKYKYASTNKIFDYIDAGLPTIIHSSHEFVSAILDRYNIRVDAEKLFMDDGFELLSTPELKKNLKKAKKELSISNHIHRLIDFYDTIDNKNT